VRRSLLSLRSAVVLTLAILTGVGAGALSALAHTSPAQCVLYGAGAFGVAVPFYDRLVGGTTEGGEGPGTSPLVSEVWGSSAGVPRAQGGHGWRGCSLWMRI
jgi:hypothetical protein